MRLGNRLGGRLRLAPVVDVSRSGERFVGCLPTVLRHYLARRDRRLIVCPDGPTAHLQLAVGETREALGSLDLSGREPLPSAVAEGAKTQRQPTVLMLPAAAVLTRSTSLPSQVRDNLNAVLRYELDRLSPFTPEQVIYDHRVVSGGKGEARIGVELALTRRDLVDGWLKRLGETGLPVDQVTWEGAWPLANLLAPTERPRHRQPLLDPIKLLLMLLLILGVAALVTPLWQRAQTLETLESEVRKARAQAAQVDQVRQELERARRGSTEVLRQKWEQPRMLAMLGELTDRIPDDTWVQSLEYQNGEVQLRGESGQATALIGLLEGAPGISGVSFRSPVTQVARTGRERFNLAFTYQQGEPAP
ncbi:MAG TPA: PilN domain-containing protein [Lamprocystis sp. (in: g-proteobacteria)]|nr:PilN domain-containing protein [Lamprocystis sp. (in: g-proteobacteria)]